MESIKEKWKGLVLCLCIAVPAWVLGKLFPIIGGAIISIILGMAAALFIKDGRREPFEKGIKFTSKKILQWAVILLGFGLDISVILKTGKQSLPIILSTITTSLVIAFVLCKVMKIQSRTATLIGVGSSICGGSAIAATAPVIDADDEEVAQSISVIFFFNVIAAIVFPWLGHAIGFLTVSGEPFGIFAGTAVNDTSSVTAAASTWDSMCGLGSATLDTAVTVKLTRTLAIIPITLALAFWRTRQSKKQGTADGGKSVSIRQIFPTFILYFIAASLITTAAAAVGIDTSIFAPVKELSRFFIVLAMAAIGLNTDIVKLVRSGGKPLILGFCCWVGITVVSLTMQHIMGLW